MCAQSTEDLPKSPLLTHSEWNYNAANPSKAIDKADIPDSVDWRKKDVVPTVYSQGPLDHVAAIVIVHSIESLWAIKTGKLRKASIKEYVDCCNVFKWNVTDYDCVAKLEGLASDDYRSENGTCASSKYKVEFPISGGKWVEPFGDACRSCC